MIMAISLFFIGIIEMLIASFWTKVVIETRVLTSGSITFINILIWYYVLRIMVDDISNWYLAIVYAIGCAIGTSFCIYLFQIRDKRAKKQGFCEAKGLQTDAKINK